MRNASHLESYRPFEVKLLPGHGLVTARSNGNVDFAMSCDGGRSSPDPFYDSGTEQTSLWHYVALQDAEW